MTEPIIRPTGLHFPWARVLKALKEVRAADSIRPMYGQETGPGLWLVADEGVYLMPNTTAMARTIVYAIECDPTKLSFDTWWANKGATFGGDDGIEFISLKSIDQLAAEHAGRPRYLHVDFMLEQFSFAILW